MISASTPPVAASGLLTVSTPAIVLLSTLSVSAVTLPSRPPPWRGGGERVTAPLGGTPPHWAQPPAGSRTPGPKLSSPGRRSTPQRGGQADPPPRPRGGR